MGFRISTHRAVRLDSENYPRRAQGRPVAASGIATAPRVHPVPHRLSANRRAHADHHTGWVGTFCRRCRVAVTRSAPKRTGRSTARGGSPGRPGRKCCTFPSQQHHQPGGSQTAPSPPSSPRCLMHSICSAAEHSPQTTLLRSEAWSTSPASSGCSTLRSACRPTTSAAPCSSSAFRSNMART